jgi:glutamyl-tRNA synthetase
VNETHLHDIIRGDVNWNKSFIDKYYLKVTECQHIINIVDDHLMETSHVIRGEKEWTSYAARLLFKFD